MKFSKMVVILIILLNILFTIGVLIVFSKTSCEPTALVAAWFSFTTGELFALSSIKKKEIKKEQEDQKDE